MKGGTKGYTPLTGLASSAYPFSGNTAKAQLWVGGKRTKKRYNRKTSRRNRRKTHKRH